MSASKPWQNRRVLSTLALVFVAGGAVGALSMSLGLHEKLHRVAVAASKKPDTSKDAVIQRFRAELGLTHDQAEQIGVVLDDYRQYYQSLQEQMDDIRSTGRSRIVGILDDSQRQKFEKMAADLAPQFQTGK